MTAFIIPSLLRQQEGPVASKNIAPVIPKFLLRGPGLTWSDL